MPFYINWTQKINNIMNNFFLMIEESTTKKMWSSTYAPSLDELMEPLIEARKIHGVYLHQVSTLPSSRLIIGARWIEKQIPSSQLEKFLREYRERTKDLPPRIPPQD